MKVYNLKPYILLTAFLVTNSCIEEFDFQGDIDQKSYVVVDAKLSTEENIQSVRIYRSSNKGSGESDPFVVDYVKVENEDDGQEYDFTVDASDASRFVGQVNLQVNQRYTLRFSINGVKYFSNSQALVSANEIDTIYSEYVEKLEFNSTTNSTNIVRGYEIYARPKNTILDKQDAVYSQWETQATFELRTDMENGCCPLCFSETKKSTGITLSKSDDYIGGRGSLISFVKFSQDIAFAYRITVFHYSLSEDVFKFWERARNLISQSGSIFDTPPFPLHGNIKSEVPEETVLGLFYLRDVKTRDYYLEVKTEHGNAITQIIQGDCRFIYPGSTAEVPSNWYPPYLY